MSVLVEVILWTIAAGLSIPHLVLIVQACAALLPRRTRVGVSAGNIRGAVLVPAHDEEAGIGRTLQVLLPQLAPGDRLVVVADNCTDRTAEVARGCGATVVERHDPAQRGKGFALDFGLRALEQNPPDVVVIVDADCLVSAGGLQRLVDEAARTGRPVQAAYVMSPPPSAGVKDRVSAFAFRFKNLVRPLGLSRLGLPCLLTGTGMAFPWPLLREAKLGHGNIVEDMQLGIDLAAVGRPPLFCPGVEVSGELPAGAAAAVRQRTRWEHGHLQTLLTQTPRLLWAAVRQGRPELLGLALELSVPPLSMLFLLWAVGVTVLALAWLAGASVGPVALLTGAGLGAVAAILAAWARFGRRELPPVALLAAPLYVLGKAPIYFRFLFNRQKAWVRTERAPAPR